MARGVLGRGRSVGVDILRKEIVEFVEPRRLPARRSECREGERPCPYVSCRFHLFLDVNEHTGRITFNFPVGVEVWDLPETCALDVAEGGLRTLEEIGILMHITRERVRQLTVQAEARVNVAFPDRNLRALLLDR